MPTLHLKNNAKRTIPLGGKVGRILADAERSVELTSSEIEKLRPKLERFKDLSYWTDVEAHIQEDVAKRMQVVDNTANQIHALKKQLEQKTHAALSTCIRVEENRIITCPREAISIFSEYAVTPKEGYWFVFIECYASSPGDAEGIIILKTQNYSTERSIVPGLFFMTALLPLQPKDTKVEVMWKSVSGSLRMKHRSISLLQVQC